LFTKKIALDHHPGHLLGSLTFLAINLQSGVFLLVLLAILLFLSFITSGAEVALFTLQARDVNMLRARHHHPGARRIISLLEERKAVYTSLLIAATFFNIGIIILSNYLMNPYLDFRQPWINWLIKILVMAFVLVLVGKIFPKVWATQNNLRFAYTTSSIIEALHLVLRRISLYMVSIADSISERTGVHQMQTMSMRELDEAIDINNEQTSTEEKNILKGIVKFGNISVKQIMRFRLEVNGIEYDRSFQYLTRKVEDLHYSRLPVYKKSLDEIVGIINTKDLLPHLSEPDFDWHQVMRQPYFVPESKLIKDLLEEFQAKRIHFAVVVDEFGGTSGIVTMEDILEEIIGDIRDEFDEDETTVKPVDENTYIVDAKVMLHDMCRAMKIPLDTFDKQKGESDSLAGLVLEVAGKFPTQNETVRLGDFTFTILEIQKNRIHSIKVSINRNYRNG
jgi:putative hemolysin